MEQKHSRSLKNVTPLIYVRIGQVATLSFLSLRPNLASTEKSAAAGRVGLNSPRF